MFICQPLGLLINIGLTGEPKLKSVKLDELDIKIHFSPLTYKFFFLDIQRYACVYIHNCMVATPD